MNLSLYEKLYEKAKELLQNGNLLVYTFIHIDEAAEKD